MNKFFPEITPIKYEGMKTDNEFAFRHYNSEELIGDKTLSEHLRFSVAYWHTFCGRGSDPFGAGTINRSWNIGNNPMEIAFNRVDAAFEFLTKINIPYFCFHDRDLAPEGNNLLESHSNLDKLAEKVKALQNQTGKKLLWGTANLFSHPRYMNGAATNPDPHVFAYAAAQVKKALEITHYLGGENYVFWGGREGYESILNTDISREQENLAKFLHMAADYAKDIGFQGQLLIEPKPKEPMSHHYDFDSATVIGFLRRYDLADKFKLNIESNHATLAGHSNYHDLQTASIQGMLGSIDANRGDLLLGWDTDQFPTNIYETTLACLVILNQKGIAPGGLNFDAKVRRSSTDVKDIFLAHIGAMDTYALGLKIAHKIITDGKLKKLIHSRYAGYAADIGEKIINNECDFNSLEKFIIQNGEPKMVSGQIERFENLLNNYIFEYISAIN